MSMTNTLTIRETVRRAKAEGIPVAESALRRLVKNGDIHAVHAGNKALLYWPKVVEFVCGTQNQN